jgi:hypothetical protein
MQWPVRWLNNRQNITGGFPPLILLSAIAVVAGFVYHKGFAIRALAYRRIGFVGAHHNAVQGTVVLGVTVVSALLNGAFNTLVGMTIHRQFLLYSWVLA